MPVYVCNISSDVAFNVLGINTTINKRIIIEYKYCEDQGMDGMEATFILKDVIYIVVGVASALGFYWKMVMSDRSQEEKIRQMQKEIEKNESIMFKKFSGIYLRFEKTEEKTKQDFTNINTEINEVKIGISTINGKLDILINKQIYNGRLN